MYTKKLIEKFKNHPEKYRQKIYVYIIYFERLLIVCLFDHCANMQRLVNSDSSTRAIAHDRRGVPRNQENSPSSIDHDSDR